MNFPQCFVYLFTTTRFKKSFETFVINFLPILLPNNIAKLVHETFRSGRAELGVPGVPRYPHLLGFCRVKI